MKLGMAVRWQLMSIASPVAPWLRPKLPLPDTR
jgi:hypothetical protein